jgi:hypothetical protein
MSTGGPESGIRNRQNRRKLPLQGRIYPLGKKGIPGINYIQSYDEIPNVATTVCHNEGKENAAFERFFNCACRRRAALHLRKVVRGILWDQYVGGFCRLQELTGC